MATTNVKSKNGDIFIVMNEGRKVAIGVIARGSNRPIKLGFFFDLKYYNDAVDRLNLTLNWKQAIYVCKFGYLEIRNGNWPTIGTLKNFSFEAWPMPVFVNHPLDPDRHTYTSYDEERLENKVCSYHKSELPRNFDLSFVVDDSMAGAFFVAERLKRLLENGVSA